MVLRNAVIAISTFVVRYLLVFVLCACLWRISYIVQPCLGEVRGWPNPPACSAATLLHRATVPGPSPDLHYMSVAFVALLIVLMGLLLGLVRSARRKLPRLLAFAILLISIAVPGVALAWLIAVIRPCLFDLLRTPIYFAMCFGLRDMLTDTPADPKVYMLAALFLACVIAVVWWRWDGIEDKAETT
jgi:hypothetical protein